MVAEDIGFVGLGNIGLPMCLRLIEVGFPLTVYGGRVEDARDSGAQVAPDLESVAASSDIVQVAVRNDEQVLSVALGEGGLVSSMAAGTILMVHSTVRPRTVHDIVDVAHPKGIAVVDAALSGGAERARKGTLSVIVGGDSNDVGRCRAVFEAIGREVFHVGPVGSGAAAKLANNVMALGNQLCALEAMKLARAYDLSEETIAAVAASSTGDSWAVRNWGFYDDLLDVHTVAGTAEIYELFAKDLWGACVAAREVGVHLPIAALLSELTPLLYGERELYLRSEDSE